MPLTPEELDEAIRLTCRWCAEGKPIVFRADTLEYCHTYESGLIMTHTFCLASGLRKAFDKPKGP